MASAVIDKVMKNHTMKKTREVKFTAIIDNKFADDFEVVLKNCKRFINVDARTFVALNLLANNRKVIEQLAKEMRELDVKPASKASVKESVFEASEDTNE